MAKKITKKASNTGKKKYTFLDDILERITEIVEVKNDGSIRIKRIELKRVLEETFENAAKISARGERVRFPIIGTLVRKEVKALKAGKYLDPFTKEEKMRKARPPSKKPRWSFPKSMREIFANKKNW